MSKGKRLTDEEREERMIAVMDAASVFLMGGSSVCAGVLAEIPLLVGVGTALMAFSLAKMLRKLGGLR